MGLLTTYGADNFILLDDYKLKCNSLDAGQPEVAVLLSGANPSVQVVTWKRGITEESLRFKYVGMDYETAQDCADALRDSLTYTKYPWQFGAYLSGQTMLYGWHRGVGTPTLDSSVTVQKHGTGCMYDVVVDARAETENYTAGGDPVGGGAPLAGKLNGIAGYSASHVLSGAHFDAAGAGNIVLVNAPTRTTQFELVGEDIYTTRISSDLSVRLVKSNWYRATTDFYAQVQYQGMTRAACKSLYNALAQKNSGGWYLPSHPWELSAWFDDGDLHIEWRQNPDVTTWQCLNDYSAREDESGMCTAELMLHSQQIEMTDDPQSYEPPDWPAAWSNVPALTNYL